jgi:diguanylate cyclase (GGDEF)-like protein/PAS domain S-box-containing protein
VIPSQIFDQIADKSTEGLALASAPNDDGADVKLVWCNKAFTKITGYDLKEVSGKRASILIGPNMSQGHHLLIIEKLMNWEQFSSKVLNNRKSGEQYWHQMTWVPLTHPDTGNRWWLYSLVELPDQTAHWAPAQSQGSTAHQHQIAAKYEDKVRRLEHEIVHLREQANSVAKEAHEDPLTGLSNRRHFEAELKSWIADLANNGPEFAVLYIDLDRFKFVNDTLGHYAGDQLLIFVANLLRKLTDHTDMVARVGGDEFVILKPLGDSALNISDLADQIVAEIQTPFAFESTTISTTASIGVAIAESSMAHPEQVVADADKALYHAKSEGKGRWSFFTQEMHANLILTKQLESDILNACDQREFTVFFQPLIDVKTGQISSAEALVRWAHPTRGLLSPASFLEVAENLGVLPKIDEIVFSQIYDALRYFDECDVLLPRVAINTSAERLSDPNLIQDIKNSGIDPDRLTIEILESVSLERMSEAVRWKLDDLAEMGVMIAMDDFGTGHASIQGLFQIKPSVLKIDRQFIKPVVSDDVSRALVSSMTAIGKCLNMRIVAEGVETEEHAQMAVAMGCDYLQGYYFGKPMSAVDLRKTMTAKNGQFWTPKSTSLTAMTQSGK